MNSNTNPTIPQKKSIPRPARNGYWPDKTPAVQLSIGEYRELILFAFRCATDLPVQAVSATIEGILDKYWDKLSPQQQKLVQEVIHVSPDDQPEKEQGKSAWQPPHTPCAKQQPPVFSPTKREHAFQNRCDKIPVSYQ